VAPAFTIITLTPNLHPTMNHRIYLIIEQDTNAIDDLLHMLKSDEDWRHLVHEYKHSITSPFDLDTDFPLKSWKEFNIEHPSAKLIEHSPYYIALIDDGNTLVFGELVK
jgi:hypothetical protein